MKTTFNFKTLFLLVLVALVFSSCTSYGKKIKSDGTKGEVYYKGDGVTESDGKKLCNYLKEIGYFDNDTKSVQLVKAPSGGYDVRFVVDEKKLKASPTAEDGFVGMGALISKNVFANQAVNIFLADEKMKDIKSLPYDKKKAEALLSVDEKKPDVDNSANASDLSGYSKRIEGGITFRWKQPVTDDEADIIGKAIIATGDFAGGTPETTNIFMEKEGDRYIVKFPVSEEFTEDPATLSLMEAVSKKLKDAAFANVPFSFYMIDVNMKPVQNWEH